ncbi:MAG: 1-(5-phosphoribosyl)-5-[(5-phosphoribosylamino)methylideneamino] imidazole-4-carboxamide isomerase [Prevotellaceae bacterium]|jgi:phosphoribosylformimino-5-aminoimidazole carboxamide ribotide isomerase|nr:1-(5-phosphoribosyl)-5-[(5-phosphoribosylamino)methylideneamino] imidazole-4-carboxamide isomerase [Prevotellaceae bacterium]
MIELIPAIDLLDGKCVRLTQGDYAAPAVYDSRPLDVARRFEDHGIRRLHLVDLDGARAGHIVHHRVLEQLAARTSLVIDFGGGLKRQEDAEIAFHSGAQMITGGSIAVKDPDTFTAWITTFGSDRIILGADVRDGRIAVSGWEETTAHAWRPFVQGYYDKGVRKIISTDIRRDGTLQGPAISLYKEQREAFPQSYIIASGGVATVEDIESLHEAGIPAVIFGKAFYEGRIQLKDLLHFTHSYNLP